EFQAKSQDQVARSPVLSGLPWLATDTIDDSGAGAWDGGPRSPDELAFLQYTSGSTAAPKGVMVSHGNLFANMRQLEVGMGHNEQTNVVSWLPLFHDMGLIGNLIHPLYLGTNCALMPPIRFIQKPIRWLRAVTRYRPHSSGGPNFAYDLCVEKTTPEEREGLDLSAWRVAFNGAEPIRAESMQAFATAFAPHGFRAEAHYPNYGLAEGTLAVTGSQRGMLPVVRGYDAAALEQHRAEPAAVDAPGGRSLVSSGHCVADADIAIADPESGARLADGAVGEIWVRGPNVAQGYWDRDEETAQTFRAHTTDGQGPYLRTGDLGFLDRGELFVTGRIKDMLIVHGRNVYPQDIERASEACHEAMVPTGAAAFCHTEDGSEHIVLVQEVTRHYRKYDLEGVVDAARAAVWGELEVPVQTVVLVKPGSNPKTSSGKIMRHQVMLSFRDGELPEVHRSDLTVAAKKATTQPPEGDRVTRTDDLGSYLRVKVAAALGQPVEQIDGARPIQSLGLDSLLAARLAHGVETELGITLPVTTFLRDITLDDLAGDLAIRLPQGTGGLPGPGDQRPPPLPLEPPREAPAMPLTRGQRALWFQYRLVPESPAYNITVSLRLLGSLDRGALQRGLDGLLARHPLLRGRVRQQRGEPVLAMDLAAAAHLERVDLTGQPAAAVEAALTASCRQPFDLTRGPLIRFCLFQRA
ncbi:MAG: AMP-binding protein, partial [Rhodobacterales bacterium]|nr:AMP-binding protein [Rhodobacterales bacterium]